MSEWMFIATGIGIGILVSAPIGAVNIMCLHRALRNGFTAGFATGLGGVAADALFATVAAFGVTAIVTFVEGHSIAFQCAGGLLLIGFGLALVLRPLNALAGRRDQSRLGGPVVAFVLCLTNPGLLFGFLAIFSGLGGMLEEADSFLAPALLVAGVCAGGMGWYAAIALIASWWRERIELSRLQRINTGAGILLAVFGIAVLGNGLYEAYAWLQ